MTQPESDTERIRRRYPRPRAPLAALVALGLLLAVLLGWVVWGAVRQANPPVSARIDTFRVVSDTQIDARLTVDRPDPAVPARCFLVVQAVTFERVGEKTVDVPADARQLTSLDVSVRTFKRATTISVESCVAVR